MDVYPVRPFYITIPYCGKTVVHLRKLQKVGEVANAPEEVVHNKDERISYLFGTKANKNDSSVNAVHYKPTPNRLVQMTKHEAVKERDQESLEKDWFEDV